MVVPLLLGIPSPLPKVPPPPPKVPPALPAMLFATELPRTKWPARQATPGAELHTLSLGLPGRVLGLPDHAVGLPIRSLGIAARWAGQPGTCSLPLETKALRREAFLLPGKVLVSVLSWLLSMVLVVVLAGAAAVAVADKQSRLANQLGPTPELPLLVLLPPSVFNGCPGQGGESGSFEVGYVV